MKAKKLKAQILLASLLASGSMWGQAPDKPFIMKTGMEYYVVSISQNGKWACGVYKDYDSDNYGFRWNLETDEIEMLDTSHETTAYQISNDGTVAGKFMDYTYNANGSGIEMAGYWKDRKWHRLEMPNNSVGSAGASSISPDGHYISGNVKDGDLTRGFVWKDGKILYELKGMTNVVMPYAVSPDGQNATGFIWNQDMQRRPIIWNSDGSYSLLKHNNNGNYEGRAFSPDGKYLLYGGGWNDDRTGVNAIYNIATGETTTLPTYGLYLGISNDKTVVGCDDNRGYI